MLPLIFSYRIEHFDWLKIDSGFNYPMASACSHLAPSDDRLFISGKSM